MKMKTDLKQIAKHPLGVLYGTLLGIVASVAAVPMFNSGMWDAALVDLAMAFILIFLMLKNTFANPKHDTSLKEKIFAWGLLIAADILVLLPTHNFAGGIISAFALTILICALVLYFSGSLMATVTIVPALWCCVFMPFHEELMLLLSYPLRLTATLLSAVVLDLSGMEIVHSGTSLTLPGVNIAITDACSGIKQLDAFILIALIVVELLHKKFLWKALHFAFIVPSVIAGNALRIILTVFLYRLFGECVFENLWHTLLGYTQIIFAILIFLAIGKVFALADRKPGEEK